MAQDRHPAPQEVIIARATPPGTSALAVVRLAGEGVLGVCAGFLSSADLSPRRATLVSASLRGEKLDDVVAVYYPADASPLGEPLVELTAHGSPLIVERLLEAARESGARPAEPGEFTRRAYLNGKLDLAQAEAVSELIAARTDAGRRAALRRLDGALSSAVRALREPAFDLLARVEASLDHPDEDVPLVAAEQARATLERIERRTLELAATFERGRAAREGARVCIVGRPNAGKSSLLNALLGFERAIVCAEPGTTRDTVEETLELAGAPVVLVDTAGLREGALDAAEAQGLARTRAAASSSDLALLVVDGSRPLEPEDEAAHRLLSEALGGRPMLRVLSKRDLPRRADFSADVEVSAKERAGLEALVAEIGRRLSADQACSSGEDAVVERRHRDLLLSAASELALARSLAAERPGDWEDRAAFHLRQACARLGQILGEGAPDEVLDAVFSRFCLGK